MPKRDDFFLPNSLKTERYTVYKTQSGSRGKREKKQRKRIHEKKKVLAQKQAE